MIAAMTSLSVNGGWVAPMESDAAFTFNAAIASERALVSRRK